MCCNVVSVRFSNILFNENLIEKLFLISNYFPTLPFKKSNLKQQKRLLTFPFTKITRLDVPLNIQFT